MNAPLRAETARLNGIDVYFEQFGEGPRLLVFNGSGSSIERTRRMLEMLGRCFEVLVHDHRGLGRTSIPPGPYTMAQYAEDGLALLDHVGWDRCRVVGSSFGGMVAQQFAVTAPERVERLVLVCTLPGGTHASYPLHELPESDPEGRLRIVDTRYTPSFLAEHAEHSALVDRLAAE